MSESRTIRLTDRVLLGGAYRRAGDVVDVRLSVAEDLVRLGVAEPVAPEPAPHTPPAGDDPSAGDAAPVGGEPSTGPLGQAGVQVHDPDAATRLPPAADAPESTTRVKGIGPATSTTLADAGVYTLADLAALDDAVLRGCAAGGVATESTLRDWREQASALLAADTTGA